MSFAFGRVAAVFRLAVFMVWCAICLVGAAAALCWWLFQRPPGHGVLDAVHVGLHIAAKTGIWVALVCLAAATCVALVGRPRWLAKRAFGWHRAGRDSDHPPHEPDVAETCAGGRR